MNVFAVTDKGLLREINEDHIFVSNEALGILPNLYIVADGMGGANAGEVASTLAVDGFVSYVKENRQIDLSVEETFIKGIEYANNNIYNQSIADKPFAGMGTTFVACTILEDDIIIANVGDSRLYVLDEELKQITIDHSYVEDLVRAGEITREESFTHPDRNMITRAMGVGEQVEIDIFKCGKKDISKVLICSDGLTNMIRDNGIKNILFSDKDLESQGNLLLKESLDQGGNDNISIIIVDIISKSEVI